MENEISLVRSICSWSYLLTRQYWTISFLIQHPTFWWIPRDVLLRMLFSAAAVLASWYCSVPSVIHRSTEWIPGFRMETSNTLWFFCILDGEIWSHSNSNQGQAWAATASRNSVGDSFALLILWWLSESVLHIYCQLVIYGRNHFRR